MKIQATQKTELFCQKYWNNVLQKNKKNLNSINKISTNFDLTDVNRYLLDYYEDGFLPDLEKSIGMKLNEFIVKSDLEFKFLKPTKTPLTLWRGVGNPDYMTNPLLKALFKKSLDAKEGDIVCMPIYAYTSTDREYSELFLRRNGGILYQIEVPQGSKISGFVDYTFPRYSRFECTGTEQLEDGKLIKLKYIKPEDTNLPKNKPVKNALKKDFINKLLKFLHYDIM